MDQIDQVDPSDPCNSPGTCEDKCGYFIHFCPMYTEAQGELIEDTIQSGKQHED